MAGDSTEEFRFFRYDGDMLCRARDIAPGVAGGFEAARDGKWIPASIVGTENAVPVSDELAAAMAAEAGVTLDG